MRREDQEEKIKKRGSRDKGLEALFTHLGDAFHDEHHVVRVDDAHLSQFVFLEELQGAKRQHRSLLQHNTSKRGEKEREKEGSRKQTVRDSMVTLCWEKILAYLLMTFSLMREEVAV